MIVRMCVVTLGIAATLAMSPVAAQHDQHQAAPAAQVSQCAQAQPVVTGLLSASLKRLEDARLTNNAAAMRDAADDVQSALVDIRAQLAPCATLQAPATDAHAGHAMPNVPPAPAPAAADPHAGHVAPAAPQAPAPRARPAAPAPAPAASPAKGHAGHVAPPAAAPAPAPAASPAEGHAGHAAPPAAAAPAPPSAAARPTAPAPPANIADLKCANAVDPKTAPRMLYQGRMYYFCTEASRAEFAKNPSTFVTAPPPSAPAHAH